MHTAATLFNWLIALLWIWRSAVALRNLPKLPNLLNEKETSAGNPGLAVIVPARNEEQAIGQMLHSLLAQEGVFIEILAVNDRSTDKTGEIMDRIAAEGREQGKSISVIHIRELPAGWMGKTHAMALAARQAAAPWLLFTDGDILFREDCLRRAISYAEKEADHLVLFPTLILKTAGERMMLSAFQALSFLSTRPWKTSDPKSRDSLGIGAFNLIRSEVYSSIGGFEGHRMEVLEDIKLGHQVKRHGFRQHVVLGRDLIQVHWAAGTLGIVRNLTKNIFAVFRFQPMLLLAACIAIAAFCLTPFYCLFGSWMMLSASILALGSMLEIYRYCERHINGIPTAYFLLLPVAACVIVYMLLRSMIVTMAQRGIVWRDTFYPLSELRKHAGPLR
ncbi:glycosyltransferase [Alloacidobacterium sp.]|uniref:glycosyltransferase n=1 Tax=Alloacidobacterium sp. TaxID=2951999 RepID=UPI002D66EB19|nr:glycosyltransferase [Alloacidobacterium sp.]HYK36671.1 glycosyltransferase [Alloacidobacterium sp.]